MEINKNNSSEMHSEEFPEDILTLIVSPEASVVISKLCEARGIKDERLIEKIAYQTGLVLLGQLPPEGFQEALEKEAGLNRETAKILTQEIGKTIFLPVKDDLLKLYSNKEKSPVIDPNPGVTEPPLPQNKLSGSDTYREGIE